MFKVLPGSYNCTIVTFFLILMFMCIITNVTFFFSYVYGYNHANIHGVTQE